MKNKLRGIIVGGIALAIMVTAAAAQDKSAERLGVLTSAIAQKTRTGRGQFDNAFRRMAVERRELMSKLSESDPAAALRNALPATTLAKMPADVAEMFERRGSFTGELTVEAECEENNYRTLRYLGSGEGRKQLYLDSEPTSEMKSGDQVAISGYEIDNKLLASADQATVTTAAAASATTGEKRVLVILVNFQDKATQPFTVEQARDVTFNQTSNFIRENSYGQTWLTGDVYGWYTIPVSSTVCDKNAIATYAKQAATNAGANLSVYNHIVYGFPSNACTFSGSSTIGGTPSQSWINHFFDINSVGHELGHGMGLFHSRALECGSEPIGGACSTIDYGDIFDIMGGGSAAHMNLYQKERMGWVNQTGFPPIQTVTESGTYWMDAYETANANVKGLKILKSTDTTTGQRTWYYLEHRTPTGFDSNLANPNYNVVNGVSIHQGSESSGSENYLLDMNAATTTWFDPALVVGSSFNDKSAGVTITVLSADNSGATVQIEMNARACNRANPTVAVTPGKSNWMSRGASFGYTVTVTNNNSGGCASEAFNLSTSLPGALTGSFTIPSLFLPNGASGSSTVNISSSTSAADGTYGFGVSAVNASNSSLVASGSASYVLVSGLDVTVSPGSAKYSRSQTASVLATVKAAGSGVGSVPLTFTMTKPGGATVTQTVSTASDGRATFSYKFDRKRDPVGTYTVTAVAANGGYTGQASTSFTVTK